MKYCSFELAGHALGGVVTSDGQHVVPFPSNLSVRQVLDMGDAGRALASQTLASRTRRVKLTEVKLLPPVPNPDKVLCVGLNYRDHAEKSGTPLPKLPLIFNKFGSSLASSSAPIRQVTVAQQQALDYEVEQVVVIGRIADGVAESDAWDYVGGYMTGNDVSERIWQLGPMNQSPVGPQWTLGKGFDTSGVCGPYLVTTDEITPEKASNMDVRCWLNDKLVQESNTKMHIFTVPQIIAHVSKFMRLLPGDLIFMGTPAGTLVEGAKAAGGFKNVKWMQPGDVLKTEVKGLGICENRIISQQEYLQSKL